MSNPKVNAVYLKNALWDTLIELKEGRITAATADSIAAQAREILRAVKVQLAVVSQSGRPVSPEMIEFATPPDKEEKGA